MDHRGHGASPSGPPPHTIENCARDVHATLCEVGAEPEVVCGHSFGGDMISSATTAEPHTHTGKVALGFAALQLSEGRAAPRRTWLFDSLPGTMPGSVVGGPRLKLLAHCQRPG